MKIVILHGLYMHGLVMQPLAQRLNKLGYQTEVISYNTLAIDDEKRISDHRQRTSTRSHQRVGRT